MSKRWVLSGHVTCPLCLRAVPTKIAVLFHRALISEDPIEVFGENVDVEEIHMSPHYDDSNNCCPVGERNFTYQQLLTLAEGLYNETSSEVA